MNKVGNKTGARILRRPLFAAALFFALGVVLGRYVYLQTLYICVAATFIIAAFLFKRKNILPLICAASFFLAAFLSAAAIDVSYVKTGDGLKVEGRVYNEPYKNDYGSTVCLLEDASIGGEKCANVKLYVTEDNAMKCGDRVKADADAETPGKVKNPGGFDEKLYLLSQGISYKAYADTAQAVRTESSFTVFFSQSRKYLGDTIDKIFDADTAPLAEAMLLGDTDGIDEETITAFKDTGMAHVLAVSGLNATILVASIFFVLKILKVGRTPRLITALTFVAAYTCVTGLTPSIVRAAIMSSAFLLGTHFGKQNDILNYFSFALIISLLLRPLDLFTAGFQLSYGAVFGMITLGAQLKRWWDKAFFWFIFIIVIHYIIRCHKSKKIKYSVLQV